MNQVSKNFILFFIILTLCVGGLFFYAYTSLKNEELRFVKTESEKIYNQIQSKITQFLLQEENQIITNLNSNQGLIGRYSDGYLLSANQTFNEGSEFNIAYFEVKYQEPSALGSNFKEESFSYSSSSGLLDKKEELDLKKALIEKLSNNKKSSKISSTYLSTDDPKTYQLYKEYGIDAKSLMDDKNKSQLGDSLKSKSTIEEKTIQKDDTSPSQPQYIDPIYQERQERKIKKNIYRDQNNQSKFNLMDWFISTSYALPNKKRSERILEPFQAILINNTDLVFYKEISIDEKKQVQGIMVDFEGFFSWIFDQSFINSSLIDYSRIIIFYQDQPLFDYGVEEIGYRENPVEVYQKKIGLSIKCT
jgi:hypothetical protein